MMTALNLRNIAAAGGNLVINAKNYTALDLRRIAEAGKNLNAKLTIIGISKLTSLDCKNIAEASPGNVTFDFTA